MSDQPEKTAAAPAPEGVAAPEAQTQVDKPQTTEATETTGAESKDEKPQEATKAEEQTATAAAPAAAAEAPKEDEKPAYLTKTPALAQFFERLPTILSNAGHGEMWGVELKDANDVPTVNVLIKFLRANEGNVKLAEEQLVKALEWRKEMNPIALTEGAYNKAKFAGLGYLTKYQAEGKEVVTTWNIYGGVKDLGFTFGDMDEFLKWRVALMELAVKDLKMDQATSVIEYEGEDPYQMVQVHDYLNVSFLRMNPSVRAATKKTIEVFATAYPELLSEKFFVNVPSIMGWMFTAMKVFLSKNTTRKFHPISYGANLAREFPSLVDQFPKVYGGKGPELQESARAVKLEEPAPEAKSEAKEDKKEEPKEEPKEAAKEEPKAEFATAEAATEVPTEATAKAK